jgi:omega-hydroxy-beta-dihydromenaquinone-9 sulfotransferase
MADAPATTSASPVSAKPPAQQQKFHAYPFWSPRFWHGMRFGDWMRLCVRHRFRIHPIRWPMAFLISLITPFNSVMGAIQRWKYGRQIDQTPIDPPPVFILGHWRSGTTYLHELMYLDERFVTPTTYQCFAPLHFLLTEWLMVRLGGWLLPRHRPMDNVLAGWDRPQEDEFALIELDSPTPYFRMAFPYDPPPDMELLDMEGVAPHDLARFEKAIVSFVKSVAYRNPKRVLLKSPPHTGRVATLARLFPGAKFIHIVRHPDALFPSTMRLWKSLDEVQGLQMPRGKEMRQYVFACFERMYGGFEKQRRTIDERSVLDIKYEDLVADPVGQLERVYRELDLGDFEPLREKLTEYVAGQKSYKTNVHELDEETRAELRRRWAGYFEKYGYK